MAPTNGNTPGRPRALLVDLNNFARYPTLSVGLLVSALRRGGFEVELLSPLSHGAPAAERERRETAWDQLQRRVYFSTQPMLVQMHEALVSGRRRWTSRLDPRVREEARLALDNRPPDVLLLSAYLDQRAPIVALGELAAARKIPLLLGGPAFNLPGVAAHWLDVPGLTALVGAEADLMLVDLVRAVIDGADLLRFPGVFLPDGRSSRIAPPIAGLDALPIPDFTDFPWDRYPNRIIPVMTGRGCSWGHCTFCSDVKVANGRSFRSRPPNAVLDELEEQSGRYRTNDVIFLDIKLNSDLAMWREIIGRFQARLPRGRWIGTVHVQASGENGLTREELQAARASGLARLSFGIETGSQKVNNSMAKGTNLERTSQFLRDAHAAGISVRATAMLSYPGETAEDIDATVKFFEQHEKFLDRVRMNRFKPIPGTRFHELYERSPERFPTLTHFTWDFRYARAHYRYALSAERSYRRAKTRLLSAVHRINRRPLQHGLEAFDGLM